MLTCGIVTLALGALLAFCAGAQAAEAPEPAPFINTWLVAGTFENDAGNTGFERDWIGEATVLPRAGDEWRYFDDRLFSRNYDDYQDLFSYFQVKRGGSAAAKVAYAHVYVHSAAAQAAELRVGADNEFKAWVNGKPAAASTKPTPHRDSVKAEVALEAGWNRLLLKVANQGGGRLGFYARLCDPAGNRLPGLAYSVDNQGDLRVATQPLEDTGPALPTAFREWPYVAADPMLDPDPNMGAYLRRKPHLAMHASPFFLAAEGGAPPYRWSLANGALPEGLRLQAEGAITGTVAVSARLGEYPFEVKVADGAGREATRKLSMAVRERPNRWYEEARLVALIHSPESILNATDADLKEFARLMKRQGHALGMMISYNNGDFKYRWPSMYEPDNPLGDLVGRYKAALEAEGIRFGMYMGNLIGPNHGGDQGALLMVEEAVRRYRPAALWFDWASHDPDGYVSLDPLYSMIRSVSPETLIVLNGVGTLYQGDWDVICMEGWGAWGERIWAVWPFEVRWPKKAPVESWRMLADPAFEYSKDISPDWQEYLRVQISMIGQGFVANIDHSPTIRTPYKTLYESVVARAHKEMAEWANPEGAPPLHEAYTWVNPGPLAEGAWGYDTINRAREAIYLHLMKDAYGKTGMPEGPELRVGPVRARAKAVRWMNRNAPLRFRQEGGDLVIALEGVAADPVDTILKVDLASPHPEVEAPPVVREPVPAGNLATHKPAQLLSADGSHTLVASGFAFAHYGVDGRPSTHAQGAYEWAWSYQVDLEKEHALRRVVIHFAPRGWATEYKLLLSADGQAWETMAHVTGCTGGTREHTFPPVKARYLRVQAVKPDGPDQEGAQMGIAELEAYE